MANEFPYPPKPWYDGQEVYYANTDNSVTVAKYDAANNTWQHVIKYRDEIDGFIYTDHVLTVPEAPYSSLRDAQALVEPWIDPPGGILQTQEDVNNTIAGVSAKAIRQQYRINDNVDFLQNSVATGFWVGLVPNQQGQLPEAGYFAGFKGNVPTTDFAEADRFVFAGEGITPSLGSANPQLAETKVGDNLLIQQHDDNHFGIYVVDNVEIIGEPTQGGSWWVWMNVRVASNRAVGDFEDGSHCTVKTSRPVFTLASEEAPVFSETGQLWYDTKNKALKVWDADAEEFVSTGGGDGGGDVDLSGYATTEYVDSAIENIDFPEVDLTGYATEEYVDTAIENIDIPDVDLSGYLPLAGGDITGATTISNGNQVALTIKNGNTDKIKFWGSGAVALVSGYSAFKDDELITKKYADDAIQTAVDNVDLDSYLPLTGGTLTGNLTVEGQLKVEGQEFKVQYPDDTTMFRIQPNADNIVLKAATINTQSTEGSLQGRTGVEIQVKPDKPLAISNTGSYQSTLEIYGYDVDAPGARARNLYITAGGNINTEGNVNAQSFVKGSELRSTKLTSGQSSNLEIYRGSGDSEERKMLIGSDSVNFDVDIKLVSSSKKDIQVQNGTKLWTGSGEIITFGGDGAFYRGNISVDDHIVNKKYVDDKVESASGGDGEAAFRRYSFKRTGWENIRAGEFGMLDASNNLTRNLDEASQIYWSGTDADGKRFANDFGAILERQDWSNYLGSTFSIHEDSEDTLIYLVSPSTTGLQGFVLLEYVAEMDLYYLGWSDATCGAMTTLYRQIMDNTTLKFFIPGVCF